MEKMRYFYVVCDYNDGDLSKGIVTISEAIIRGLSLSLRQSPTMNLMSADMRWAALITITGFHTGLI